jgi:site-specific recombinase XerD
MPKHLPQVLLGTELTALWQAVRNPIYLAIFQLMYASGLRISEACALRPEQIDSQRMVIRLRGKGDKDRYTMLSKRLLRHLRAYWRAVRPDNGWMFPGRKPHCHITRRATRHAFRSAVAAARITKPVTTHCLRHTFATHLVDLGTPLTVVQTVLGHASLKTTRIYLHTSVEAISRTTSPLDLLGTPNGAIFG